MEDRKYQYVMAWYWICMSAETNKKRAHELYKLRTRLFEEYWGFSK